MKYMLMKYASRAAIDAMAGKETAASPAGTPEEVRAMGEFMGRWTDELAEPGEFVDAAGSAAQVLMWSSSSGEARGRRSPVPRHPPDIRCLIYTTNAIESLNADSGRPPDVAGTSPTRRLEEHDQHAHPVPGRPHHPLSN